MLFGPPAKSAPRDLGGRGRLPESVDVASRGGLVMRLSAKQRRAALSLMVEPLPPMVRNRLLLDKTFRSRFAMEPKFVLPLGPNYSVETHSLHQAQRAAIAGRKSAMLTLSDGKRVRAKLSRRGGRASL